MIEAQIEQDLKSAMLARDREKVDTLRGIKSTFLYAKVAAGTRDKGLSDEEAMKLLQKEAKKRLESAELYKQGGEQERADKELKEKQIIEAYLPEKMSEQELEMMINQVLSDNPDANMGQIIAEVKMKTAGSADGADIARIVKAKIEK
ncbi:MAG: GatB/YqeY domain-containing protein [Candidatus Saccharimonadales bacterium]